MPFFYSNNKQATGWPRPNMVVSARNYSGGKPMSPSNGIQLLRTRICIVFILISSLALLLLFIMWETNKFCKRKCVDNIKSAQHMHGFKSYSYIDLEKIWRWTCYLLPHCLNVNCHWSNRIKKSELVALSLSAGNSRLVSKWIAF